MQIFNEENMLKTCNDIYVQSSEIDSDFGNCKELSKDIKDSKGVKDIKDFNELHEKLKNDYKSKRTNDLVNPSSTFQSLDGDANIQSSKNSKNSKTSKTSKASKISKNYSNSGEDQNLSDKISNIPNLSKTPIDKDKINNQKENLQNKIDNFSNNFIKSSSQNLKNPITTNDNNVNQVPELDTLKENSAKISKIDKIYDIERSKKSDFNDVTITHKQEKSTEISEKPNNIHQEKNTKIDSSNIKIQRKSTEREKLNRLARKSFKKNSGCKMTLIPC